MSTEFLHFLLQLFPEIFVSFSAVLGEDVTCEHLLAVCVVVVEGGVAGGLRQADVGGGGAGDDRVLPHLRLHQSPARLHSSLLLSTGGVLTLALRYTVVN